jgi:ABC-type antimicrobial peptide transport system permease subunit
MTAWRYILASLRQYRRIHLAVAAGVAIAAAVITGALLVGDSMRGSLRTLALEGLGRVDSVLIAEHPFRAALADEWLETSGMPSEIDAAVPLLLAQGAAVATGEDGQARRAAQLEVIGAPPPFWMLDSDAAAPPKLGRRDVALTATVATELDVAVGDAILLRLPLSGSIPADSTLGEKEQTTASRRLTVVAILPEQGGPSLARFRLRPSQAPPRNVFVSLAALQDLLELPEQANAIALAVDAPHAAAALDTAQTTAARTALRPELADFGLSVEPEPGYVRVTADRLVLPPHVVETAERQFGDRDVQPVVTYLANTISAGDRSIPYSTVVGVDSIPVIGPVLDDAGAPIVLADDEVALNDWAANDLGVTVGDRVKLAWYEPETTHGELREAAPLELTVRAVVPLEEDGQPTVAADPNLAPELPGVTDQASIDDWDLPFELVETIRREDEEYWDQHRTTPKAFVSHGLAERLWKSRWGVESVLRISPPLNGGAKGGIADLNPSATSDVAKISSALRTHLDSAAMGMTLITVKRHALAAAAGTTPFDGLFLGFSFFLMAAAVMLVALLYRLGIEQRASEVGLLSSLGMPPRQISRLLLAEGGIVAAIGAAVGALAGIGYARLIIHGLNTWWVAATTTPFLELHVTPRSIAIGFFAGLLVALATMAWSLRRFSRLPTRELLAGQTEAALPAIGGSGRFARWAPPVAILAAIALGFVAMNLIGEARAISFMAGGALVLAGMLLAIRAKLREPVLNPPASLSLVGLAARNARRNPARTMLALGLAAAASFLIVALSAFRLAPTDAGTGGFDLLASTDAPLYVDLGADASRRELGFTAAESAALADSTFISCRVRTGEDASCLNLYQTTQPRVLGVPPELTAASRFAWAATAAGADDGWKLLDGDLGVDAAGRPIVPVVFDRNTAFYSLKLYRVGDRLAIQDGNGRDATLQIVGLLANSVLQGDALISDANFQRLFPDESGRQFFLICRGKSAPPTPDLAALLETQLEDYGFDAVDAKARLGELLAVQNTYLSTFQSLGALGLLLGVAGLAIVQLRSVLERRGELALMQAAGFRRRRLAAMVLAENLVLLLGGLAIGCLAALVAVLPQAIVEPAGIPWRTLAGLLLAVAAAGALAAWAASRSVLRAPLLPALRGD